MVDGCTAVEASVEKYSATVVGAISFTVDAENT